MRVLKYGMAYLRGVKLKLYFNIFRRDCHCGKFVRIMRGTEIRVKKGSKVIIGDDVSIGKYTLISALNGGKINIGSDVGIGDMNRIICHNNISIGKETILAPNVNIYDHDHSFNENGIEKRKYKTSPITIGEKSWISINTVILRGSHIGDKSVVGAGCIVKGNIESKQVFFQKRENVVKKIEE